MLHTDWTTTPVDDVIWTVTYLGSGLLLGHVVVVALAGGIPSPVAPESGRVWLRKLAEPSMEEYYD